jgi:hypothetical protein
MTTDNRSASKLPTWAARESTWGMKIDSGPFLGIIKNNVDPARLGRVQVFIPELGGTELEPSSWFTVQYASPFAGSTVGIPGSTQTDGFGIEQQTYGFWAVPPDLGVYVLVTFVMGDPTRGYFFACIPNTPVQGMTPAIGRPVNNTEIIIPEGFGEDRIADDSYLPVSELNTNSENSETSGDFVTKQKILHSYQANIVIEQGLDTDPTRGTVTSSSQRDTPSRVYGWSTPGRTTPDETDFPNFEELVDTGKMTIAQFQSYWVARKGGHSFVMDDGDVDGESNLVRIRSAGGHQILMHDTEEIMYIINSKGTAWVELTPEGSINVFSGNCINVRAAQDLNFHADGNVNIHAGDTINMYGGSTIRSQTKLQLAIADTLFNINAGNMGVRSGGSINMRSLNGSWENAGLLALKSGTGTWENSGELSLMSSNGGWKTTNGDLKLYADGNKIYLNTAGQIPTPPVAPEEPDINPPFEMYNQINARYDYESNYWYNTKKDFESIAPFTPTHEPWERQTGALKHANGTVESPMRQTPGK